LRGNVNWMAARQASVDSEDYGNDIGKLWPISYEGQSDTACFDNALEFLVRGGYSLARAPEEITVRDVIQASELTTFDLHCVSHPVDAERCAEAENCSIRPVWMLLQKRIDEVLEGVRLSDLLADESVVRDRVGLPPYESAADVPGALPILQS
jgi:hypothetical protein